MPSVPAETQGCVSLLLRALSPFERKNGRASSQHQARVSPLLPAAIEVDSNREQLACNLEESPSAVRISAAAFLCVEDAASVEHDAPLGICKRHERARQVAELDNATQTIAKTPLRPASIIEKDCAERQALAVSPDVAVLLPMLV
jgi:hypothetical protein